MDNKEKNDIVCLCKQVSRGIILDAIKNGCDTVEAVGEKTCAGTQCGACKPAIEKMILPDDHC